MSDCNYLNDKGKCTEDKECFINLPEYENCWNCYKKYIFSKKHTLHECADLLRTSHTTVAQIEKNALEKLKSIISQLSK